MKKFLLTLFLLSIQTCAHTDPEPAATVAISQITVRSAPELHAALEEAGFAVFAQETAGLLASIAGKTVSPHDIFWTFKRTQGYYEHRGFVLSIEQKTQICLILVNNDQNNLDAVRAEERSLEPQQQQETFEFDSNSEATGPNENYERSGRMRVTRTYSDDLDIPTSFL